MLVFLSAVAENQPANKNRMTTELSNFAEQLRAAIQGRDAALRRPVGAARQPCLELEFDSLALELFALQFKHNAAYRKICESRGLTPGIVEHWTQIPAVPTAAFKELELTCLAPVERTAVFHSSGTTEQKPSRHFHSAESLKVYEASLWVWFRHHLLSDKLKLELQPSAAPVGVQASACGCSGEDFGLLILTPPAAQAPHSSLVHMFETIQQQFGGASVPASRAGFVGKLAADGSWTLNFDATLAALNSSLVTRLPAEASAKAGHPSLLLGTAFSFVHLLDYLAERNLRFDLPAGSRVMETGGYKNRSRSMPKTELHQLITERLGVPPTHIICEYGMSELSSQAYDSAIHPPSSILHPRVFQFPPWARVQIISPETGREVADGETGLIRVFDLANVFSVMAIQTEDLGIRRGDEFELIGRVALAEARGCSLMTI
jgi:Acyl-protein synthetase, LuxE